MLYFVGVDVFFKAPCNDRCGWLITSKDMILFAKYSYEVSKMQNILSDLAFWVYNIPNLLLNLHNCE